MRTAAIAAGLRATKLVSSWTARPATLRATYLADQQSAILADGKA